MLGESEGGEMRTYKPYETSALCELMRVCYKMGWYSGAPTLFTIRMIGQFEGHGRASETWEHDFQIELAEVTADAEQEVVDVVYHGAPKKPSLSQYVRENSLPGGTYRAETLDGACRKALAAIQAFRAEVVR